MRRTLLRFAAVIALFLITSATLQAQDATQNATPPASQSAPPVPKRIRVGGNVESAKLKFQPLPVYPQAAKTANISGTVILHVIIAKDGSVQTVQYISGHPLLMKAAMDAVKQWKYEPTTLNGEPLEVDTTVSVDFTLGGSAPAPAGSAAASAPAAQASTDIDPQFKADILHLLDVTHAVEKAQSAGRAAFEPLRAQVLASMPATPNREKIVSAYLDKLLALFQGPEFTDDLVAVYSKYLSDDDVKAVTQFYETPAGRHMNDHLADLVTDSMKTDSNSSWVICRKFSPNCARNTPNSKARPNSVPPPTTRKANSSRPPRSQLQAPPPR